ncbi:hypothetical protein Bra3105_06665 [Brachybacterium halotolerans subsp. kimchii]|uniref:hypothetical protein n=1 Tax=Brachybacterium halotolerans TaxID=2795215 RepID=UPI001E4B25E2|nr:hypothetical protein [Brachybacterium halotolerans]UEJ83989.1 hypothetical protein Bra3105_06665 [Brachybacterium halotolerans subsp. kimchii]
MTAPTWLKKSRPFAAAVIDVVNSIRKDLEVSNDSATREIATAASVTTVAYALLDLSDGVRDVAAAIRATKEDQ